MTFTNTPWAAKVHELIAEMGEAAPDDLFLQIMWDNDYTPERAAEVWGAQQAEARLVADEDVISDEEAADVRPAHEIAEGEELEFLVRFDSCVLALRRITNPDGHPLHSTFALVVDDYEDIPGVSRRVHGLSYEEIRVLAVLLGKVV